ncbi:hypothetical protein HY251_06600 [bacterium]|nr:hypothetical protein [bacterium]
MTPPLADQPPRARTHVPGRALLLSVLGLTVALFALNTVIMRDGFVASLETINDLVNNALPSLRELVEARGDLHRIRAHVGDVLATQGKEREEHERALRATLAKLEQHVSVERNFPPFAEEPPLQDALARALARVNAGIEAVLAAKDPDSALRAKRSELDPALDAAFDTLGVLTEFNISQAHQAADAIVQRHERAKTHALVILVAFLAAVVVVGGIAQHHLARAEREVTTRMAELDAFASRVAHDLRGPLSPVRMALALAAREGTSPETIRQTAKTADRSIERMVSLIDGLLQFARAAAHPEPGARASVDEVAKEIVADVAPLREKEKAELSVEVEPGLEVAASNGAVISITANLVRNALMYLGESARRSVVLRAARAGDAIEIEVADTGPGISPELVPRLFKPFERGSTRPDGQGLGLATVKRLVEGHGGSISVRSSPGNGSTFRVELPAAR